MESQFWAQWCLLWYTFSCSGIPILPQAAVGYDGTQEGEKVAEHGKGMEEGRGAVLTEQELVSKKENQDSFMQWRERKRDKKRE